MSNIYGLLKKDMSAIQKFQETTIIVNDITKVTVDASMEIYKTIISNNNNHISNTNISNTIISHNISNVSEVQSKDIVFNQKYGYYTFDSGTQRDGRSISVAEQFAGQTSSSAHLSTGIYLDSLLTWTVVLGIKGMFIVPEIVVTKKLRLAGVSNHPITWDDDPTDSTWHLLPMYDDNRIRGLRITSNNGTSYDYPPYENTANISLSYLDNNNDLKFIKVISAWPVMPVPQKHCTTFWKPVMNELGLMELYPKQIFNMEVYRTGIMKTTYLQLLPDNNYRYMSNGIPHVQSLNTYRNMLRVLKEKCIDIIPFLFPATVQIIDWIPVIDRFIYTNSVYTCIFEGYSTIIYNNLETDMGSIFDTGPRMLYTNIKIYIIFPCLNLYK